MAKDVIPTIEQQDALSRDVKQRLDARARSWLEDSKVRAALQRFKPEDEEVLRAG